MRHRIILIAFVISILAKAPPSFSTTTYQPITFVRKVLEDHFAGRSLNWTDRSEVNLPDGGLFITISKGGKTRACWGNVERRYSTASQALLYTSLNAVTKEYRFQPIQESEIPQLKIQITVIQDQQPIMRLQGQNPLRDGLMVRLGSRSAVILPGEALSAHHQWVLAKLKAGIPTGQPHQLYRLRTKIYRE
ncbi:MAG: AMMECR1 domain-containing protein [Candidatus Caenarcaniphilales bacterium]|nr:AMMECR1 domain-containing protein [Candidatus Caenarcaniphilales bacterium]